MSFIGSVFTGTADYATDIAAIGSVFSGIADYSTDIAAIGSVFTGKADYATDFSSIGSVYVVPAKPATTASVATPSLYNKLDAISGTTVTSAVGNDGTSTGTVTQVAQHPSGSGNSLEFSSSRLLFDTTALDGTATYTISWWERPTAVSYTHLTLPTNREV